MRSFKPATLAVVRVVLPSVGCALQSVTVVSAAATVMAAPAATVMAPAATTVMAPVMMAEVVEVVVVSAKVAETKDERRAVIAVVTVVVVAVAVVVITVVVIIVVELSAIVGVSLPVRRIAAILAVLFDAYAIAVGAAVGAGVVVRGCRLRRTQCGRNNSAGSDCN